MSRCPVCGFSDSLSKRSRRQLCYYWALLDLVCDNISVQVFSGEIGKLNLHKHLKNKLLEPEPIYDKDGNVLCYESPSIALDKMKPEEFRKYIDSVKDYVFSVILPENYRESFEQELFSRFIL